MAKIVLKTNLVNSTVSIPQANVNAVIGKIPKAVEINITPVSGYKIDAGNFSVGLTPESIGSIRFLNGSNGNVIMRVVFNYFTYSGALLVINLPVNVKSKLITNSFRLEEKLFIDNNVIVNDELLRGKTTYAGGAQNIVGKPGQTIGVITKTFSVPDNYYFATEPKHVISGDGSRYKTSTSEKRDSGGRLISKTFIIKYVFPNIALSARIINRIAFTAKSKEIKISLKDKPVTTAKEGKIYSIDTGRNIGPTGGVKVVVVKGIPGTTFSVDITGGDGALYNEATGSFSQGKPLTGVIPEARKGIGYGEYKKSILIPASGTASAVNIKLSTKADIDHVKLANYILKPIENKAEGATVIKQEININPTLTIALKDGGPIDTSASPDGHPGIFKIFRQAIRGESTNATPTVILGEHYVANGTRSIGAGVSGSSVSSFLSENPTVSEKGKKEKGRTFIVAADGEANNLRINRVPKYAAKGYLRWDFTTQLGFADSDTKSEQVNGEKILSDFGTSIRHTVTSDTSDGVNLDFSENGWNIKNIKVSLEGINIVGKTDLASSGGDPNIYQYVKVNITDVQGTFGLEDLTIELNLKNFLSTI